MLQGDLLSFEEYIEDWAENHPDLKFFLFGSIERGAEYARGFDDFAYPYAWLEQPSIIPEDNEAGNTNDVFHFGISVLIKAPLDDRRAQILAQHQSILILNSLRKKIKHDQLQGTIECEVNKMRMDPILSVKNESEYGYRLEMQLGFNVNQYVC